VPHDVSIVGYDDIPEAEHFAPPLTTMRQDFAELGRDLMSTVLGLLNDREVAVAHRIPQLRIRSSTLVRPGYDPAPVVGAGRTIAL
jgi:DNA-binding LacI/PurR family transcriptional regulator